jgi:acyl-homoserine-lactone acylase
LAICLVCWYNITWSQITIQNIEIVRDAYGVPHIFGETDAEVAYGLAWAHAEDDFKTIQLAYMAGNGLLSKHKGIKAAPIDFLSQVIESQKTSDSLYNTLHSDFRKVLDGYTEGINRYAELHPNEVLEKELFPITPEKIVAYTFFQLFVSNQADDLMIAIVNDVVPVYKPVINEDTKGSNTFALNSVKTGEKASYLAINTHQPLDGPTSWYEAHLISKEGTNILGATFAGAPCILTGVNEYLGWSHTVNYPDKADVYSLEMHPQKKQVYVVDGKEYRLKKKKAQFYIKVLGIPVRLSKTYYTSIYGPTLKNKSGYFSVRTPTLFNIKAMEQWWRMNKAQSFTEFYNILKMNALPGYNIGYADKNDTIFYISNGRIPKRSEQYDWTKVVPGNTLKTLWTEYYQTEELPQVINPKSGFVYNANHSPFKSTSQNENPQAEAFSKTMNYELYDNNRSTRLLQLIEENSIIDYKTFKKIKYDRTLPTPLAYNFVDFNALFDMKPEDYPDIEKLLTRIQLWDRTADAYSMGAGAYAVFYYIIGEYYDQLGPSKKFNPLLIATCLRKAQKYMLKHFGTIDIRLGDYQKLVRGNKEIPIYGLPDVITAMRGEPYKNGTIQITHGESYIGLVRFTPTETEIETVISYGSSDHSSSPHYDDQMEMYANFQTKKMSLKKDEVYKKAVKIYRPD